MASKAKLVTRTATSSSVTTDNIAKDSALTHAELDSNLINLRDQTIGIVGDDSATIDIKAGESLYIQGGTNVTTATNSDGTLTINASDSTLSLIDEDNMATDSATRPPSQQSVKAYVDASTGTITALNNATANELVTVGATTTELDAESGLTYDGSTLAVTGALTATGAITTSGDASDISTDTISIDSGSATISGLRSNEDLNLQANGTGLIVISANSGTFSNWSTQSRYNGSNNMYYEDLTHTIANDRRYTNNLTTKIKLDSGQRTNNSNDRWRQYAYMEFDLNGSSTTPTSSYLSRGPQGFNTQVDVKNSSANDSEIGNASGQMSGVSAYTSSTGDISFNASDSSSTNVGPAAYTSWVDINPNSGSTISIPNVYQYYVTGVSTGGSGTTAITNSYAFYTRANSGSSDITNEYAFYTADADMMSAIGKLESYREKINALTSSATITVDCSLAPVHTVTLGVNTEFNITNLGTGQSVTIIITQDGGGTNTATWGTSGSTAVKFAGGSSTLSTAGDAIDVATIFNDGTNYIGNLALAYA